MTTPTPSDNQAPKGQWRSANGLPDLAPGPWWGKAVSGKLHIDSPIDRARRRTKDSHDGADAAESSRPTTGGPDRG